jgi:hypothetical protein
MVSQKEILLDYYEGAYGPTIRIDAQSMEDLLGIKNIFLQLAGSSSQAIDLAEKEGVKTTGLNQFILRWVPDKPEVKKKLVLLSNTNTDIAFEWAMSAKNWKRIAGLIDGLIESNAPGHQYLTEEGVDDAVVELAFKE